MDGQSDAGAIGIRANGEGNVVYDIAVINCLFQGEDGQQSDSAISTEVPTYGWIIRDNVFAGVGIGLSLGLSDGSEPFVDGLIDRNLFEDTIGQAILIPFQAPWPTAAGLPVDPTNTIIRNNVLIKDDDIGDDGPTATVEIGGFPESGLGGTNVYELYGNFFYHNQSAPLLQGSGRLTVHDNVFVDALDNSIYLSSADVTLESAHIYDNTFYGGSTAVYFFNQAETDDFVVGNLVFGDATTTGVVTVEHDNLVYSVAQAATVVTAPSTTLGSMDFYPLDGQAQGTAIDMTSVDGEPSYANDFNGTARDFTFRGAYSGEGTNPGWPLAEGIKGDAALGGAGGGGGGVSTGSLSTSASGSSLNTESVGGGLKVPEKENCHCSTVGTSDSDHRFELLAFLAPLALVVGRMRRRRNWG